ncbi:hypothetical protein CYMTET_38204 [Cymbomonas tetramitiformis]|uniref:Uncharacterized protein n=1 Tax=Cymbomonas tetramitiformis TaxID=36881 RepID=A0AAE0CDX9_9CHLO|nr:hypothetical protein CYMTET_38204 [Cymbomonas tetramitiformis]
MLNPSLFRSDPERRWGRHTCDRLLLFLQEVRASASTAFPVWQKQFWWPLLCPDGPVLQWDELKISEHDPLEQRHLANMRRAAVGTRDKGAMSEWVQDSAEVPSPDKAGDSCHVLAAPCQLVEELF